MDDAITVLNSSAMCAKLVPDGLRHDSTMTPQLGLQDAHVLVEVVGLFGDDGDGFAQLRDLDREQE